MPIEAPVLRTVNDLTAAWLESALGTGPIAAVGARGRGGRISEFPRAMCAVRDRDGRTGVAWVEWNRNRSLV
jgi:hypothetical protein